MTEFAVLSDPAAGSRRRQAGEALIDLDSFVPGLRVEGHLPECQHPERQVPDCDWCLWAIGHSGVREACDRLADVRTLITDHDRRNGDVSVAWVVAAGDLLDPIDVAAGTDGVPPDVVVASVRALLARLHYGAAGEAERLRQRLDIAVAAGGPVERRCLAGAATLVSAALQRSEERHRWDTLSTGTQRILERASRLVSVENQADHLSSEVDRLHWDGVPDLRTQPEWKRRPPPDHPSPSQEGRPRDRPPSESRPASGSLESFVVEAVMDELSDDLGDAALELADVAEPVEWTRDLGRRRLSSSTRRLIWRRARIDWHLTFLDSGRAACWQGGSDDTTTVPWTIALAVDEGGRLGLVSATHVDP